MKFAKLCLPMLLTFSLFTSSCSTYYKDYYPDRSIATEVTAPLNADELFTIKSTANVVKGNNFIKQMMDSYIYKQYQGVEFKFIEDPKMASDSAFKIQPTIENQSYKVNIYYSVGAKADAEASAELQRFVEEMMSKRFTSQFSIFELFYNAKAQDFVTLQVIAKMRLNAATVNDQVTEKAAYWKEINEKFEDTERVYNKKIKTLENERRAVMDVLDKVADDEQFRSLVAKNDRKGAAKLLRQYLPWEQMPPFEKLFWENHLAIMADPLPYEDRVLIYRGIDDDIIQVAREGGKELSREEAIKEQKMFLMSTMMTKNQGTWNRRLRSLTAMYEKFMGTDNNNSSEYTRAVRITNMFVKHSKEPKGSPFLSYTPKFNVAYGFGMKRSTAYFIDPRMMYFNYASKYATEIEFLLPIMSFPDDLAGVYDKETHPDVQNAEKFLKERAIERLDRELGAGKGAATFERIQLNSTKYFKPVMAGTGGAVAAPKPDGKFVSFFKKLFGMSTNKAAEEITEKSDMPCLDLIQVFWK